MSALSNKKLYPVIHCICPFEQGGIGHALRNIRIATNAGVDGIFLIGHGLSYLDLITIYDQARKQFPEIWIGINFLDLSHSGSWEQLSVAANACHRLNALWIDSLPNKKLRTKEGIEIFGGVAFKYINPNQSGDELKRSCEQAGTLVDIVTTSGDKTGSPPEILKLKTMRDYLPSKTPLALASGVNDENIVSFLPYVDKFLVASSITERDLSQGNQEYLISERVEKLAYLIHV